MVVFAIHSHESAMGVHVFPTLTLLPTSFPYPIPQGHPSAPALSTLSHALNLDWRSVSHMVIYMFQCYSLKSSHPRLLPQSQKSVKNSKVSSGLAHLQTHTCPFSISLPQEDFCYIEPKASQSKYTLCNSEFRRCEHFV